MGPLGAGARSVAACGAALLLAAGCGGDDSENGEDASQRAPQKSQPARVEAALKAQLEATLLVLQVQTVACTPKGEDFTCRVRGISGGQRRSGTLRLTAQGTTGNRFLGSGKLAGRGGHIRFSRFVVDLDKPAPAKPAGKPGRSPLEQQIELSLEQRDPQLLITRLSCPEGRATGAGAKFTCRAKGPYGVSPAVIDIRVTQTDDTGKRFELRGDIDFTDPAGRKQHGTFRNVRVIVP
jgi:hypothetical protein